MDMFIPAFHHLIRVVDRDCVRCRIPRTFFNWMDMTILNSICFGYWYSNDQGYESSKRYNVGEMHCER
jgi:hypothetical protein